MHYVLEILVDKESIISLKDLSEIFTLEIGDVVCTGTNGRGGEAI